MTVLEILAENNGKSVEEIRAEIRVAIDAAWNDPASEDFRRTLFPTGKPTPEKFIATLARLAK